MEKKHKKKKEGKKNRESGYHGDREKRHIPGQQSPHDEPRHDPAERREEKPGRKES